MDLFVTCSPGVEPALQQEMQGLRLGHVERQVGGVFFRGTWKDAMRANLWLRTAIRVLARLDRFEARDADELYSRVREIPWERYLQPEGSLVVSAQSRDSELSHTRFLEQRVKDAIVDRFRQRTGTRPRVDKEDPDCSIHVHLQKNRCTLSLDTSGPSLHKRGWRTFQGQAPLNEALAAALIIYSGWDLRSPLIDPFCGSATLLIEAAMLASRHAPGLYRSSFAFEKLPGHRPDAWQSLREEARQEIRKQGKLIVLGRDRSAKVLARAKQNLHASGWEGDIQLETGTLESFAPRKGWNGWIVCNPPFGERVGPEEGMQEIAQALARMLAERSRGFHFGILSGNEILTRALQVLQPESRQVLHGGLPCQFLTGRIDG